MADEATRGGQDSRAGGASRASWVPPLMTEVAARLLADGYAVTPGFVHPRDQGQLAAEALQHWNDGAFRTARVGQGPTATVQPEIRTDRVLWLDQTRATATQRRYMKRLARLRVAVNQATFAGLYDWEGHLAMYPSGAFYRPHLDAFEQNSSRVVTTVLYLNDDWAPGLGGELRIWPGERAGEGTPIDVAPVSGTLVTFWSDRYLHEVLPSRFERISITGWFRHRTPDVLRAASFR